MGNEQPPLPDDAKPFGPEIEDEDVDLSALPGAEEVEGILNDVPELQIEDRKKDPELASFGDGIFNEPAPAPEAQPVSERERLRERVAEIVLQDSGVRIYQSISSSASPNGSAGFQDLETRFQGRRPQHRIIDEIECQLLEPGVSGIVDFKKIFEDRGIKEVIDIRREMKPIYETIKIKGRKGVFGIGKTPDTTKQQDTRRTEPELHSEIVSGGKREPAVRFTYYIPQTDWKDYSGRFGQTMIAEIILPESAAKEVEAVLDRDPAAMRTIVERVMKEKLLKDPSAWETAPGPYTDPLRPPYERWASQPNGGKIYIQKEGDVPGFHEENFRKAEDTLGEAPKPQIKDLKKAPEPAPVEAEVAADPVVKTAPTPEAQPVSEPEPEPEPAPAVEPAPEPTPVQPTPEVSPYAPDNSAKSPETAPTVEKRRASVRFILSATGEIMGILRQVKEVGDAVVEAYKARKAEDGLNEDEEDIELAPGFTNPPETETKATPDSEAVPVFKPLPVETIPTTAPQLSPEEREKVRQNFETAIPKLKTFDLDDALSTPAFSAYLAEKGLTISGNETPVEIAALQSSYESLRLRNETRAKLRELYQGKINQEFGMRLRDEDLDHIDDFLLTCENNPLLETFLKNINQTIDLYYGSKEFLKEAEVKLATKAEVVERLAQQKGAKTDLERDEKRVTQRAETIQQLQSVLRRRGVIYVKGEKRPTRKEAKQALEELQNRYGAKIEVKWWERINTNFGRERERNLLLNLLKKKNEEEGADSRNMSFVTKQLTKIVEDTSKKENELAEITKIEDILPQFKAEFETFEADLFTFGNLYQESFRSAQKSAQEEVEAMIDAAAGSDGFLDPGELTELLKKMDMRVAGLDPASAIVQKFEQGIVERLQTHFTEALKDFDVLGDKRQAVIEKIKAYGPRGVKSAAAVLTTLIEAEPSGSSKRNLLILMRARINQ